jgi:hypothetical protein
MSTYDYDELKLNMLSQNGVTFVNDHEKTLHHSRTNHDQHLYVETLIKLINYTFSRLLNHKFKQYATMLRENYPGVYYSQVYADAFSSPYLNYSFSDMEGIVDRRLQLEVEFKATQHTFNKIFK